MPAPDDTQPKRPSGGAVPPSKTDDNGPGCLAWGLLLVAGGAFSLLVVFVAVLLGYFSGQGAVAENIAGTQQAFVAEQLSTWIPRDIENGNTELLQVRLEGLAVLTPAPPEVAALVATGTQLALDTQPTATLTPSPTQTPAPTQPTTTAPTQAPTTAPPPTANSSILDEDAPLFDVDALFAEAEAQMSAGDYQEAVRTLDAVVALDETYRPGEVEAALFDAWNTLALRLLRSGDPADLAAGIRAANEASTYGDIGDLAYESYIAGLYLDAQSKEELNPQGAVGVYSTIYTQTPGYLDVRNKLYTLRLAIGDELYEAFDYCPAAEQYQAALAIQPGAAQLEEKLQAAQAGCGGGEVPPNDGATGTQAPAPVGEVSEPTPDAPDAPPTQAPIGQR